MSWSHFSEYRIEMKSTLKITSPIFLNVYSSIEDDMYAQILMLLENMTNTKDDEVELPKAVGSKMTLQELQV